MATCLIFKGPLKVISKLSAEHSRTQGKQPFLGLHGHFHDDAPDPSNEHIEPSESPKTSRGKTRSLRNTVQAITVFRVTAIEGSDHVSSGCRSGVRMQAAFAKTRKAG
jgi:hypothetical protein